MKIDIIREGTIGEEDRIQELKDNMEGQEGKLMENFKVI